MRDVILAAAGATADGIVVADVESGGDRGRNRSTT